MFITELPGDGNSTIVPKSQWMFSSIGKRRECRCWHWCHARNLLPTEYIWIHSQQNSSIWWCCYLPTGKSKLNSPFTNIQPTGPKKNIRTFPPQPPAMPIILAALISGLDPKKRNFKRSQEDYKKCWFRGYKIKFPHQACNLWTSIPWKKKLFMFRHFKHRTSSWPRIPPEYLVGRPKRVGVSHNHGFTQTLGNVAIEIVLDPLRLKGGSSVVIRITSLNIPPFRWSLGYFPGN